MPSVYPSTTHLSTSSLWLGFVMAAMYCMMYLLASVFPAPLSPEMQNTERVHNTDEQISRAAYIFSFYSFYFLNAGYERVCEL